jgi:hypothetical protein
MPTQQQVEQYERYMQTGVCACGQPEEKHVDTYEDLRRSDTIACKLLRSEVQKWNMITARFER